MSHKIKLMIATEDEEYVQYFLQYVRQSEWNQRLIIQSYTRLDQWISVIEQELDASILFVSSAWCDQMDVSTLRIPVVVMSEKSVVTDEMPYPFIFKYQHLHQVITQLLRHIQPKSKEESFLEKKQTRVLSVYSSVGGCGKTTLALNLSQQLARTRKKVLYLNLEMFNSVAMMFSQPEQDEFARLVYYVKNKPERLQEKLTHAMQYEERLQCDVIQPSVQCKDVLDLTASDLQMLIQTIVEVRQYDVVVVDLDSLLDQRFYGVFQACDQLLWLLTDDLSCKMKTKRLLQECAVHLGEKFDDLRRKIKFVIHKYTGTLSNSFEPDEIDIFSYLPYIPNWKSIHDGMQLISSEVYQQHVLELYQNLTGEAVTKEEVSIG